MTEAHFHTPFTSQRQQAAALAYSRAFNSARSANGIKRKASLRELEAARKNLAPLEIAIMDLAAGRGALINGLARKVGRHPRDLWTLYISACEKLAIHFGIRDSRDGPAEPL